MIQCSEPLNAESRYKPSKDILGPNAIADIESCQPILLIHFKTLPHPLKVQLQNFSIAHRASRPKGGPLPRSVPLRPSPRDYEHYSLQHIQNNQYGAMLRSSREQMRGESNGTHDLACMYASSPVESRLGVLMRFSKDYENVFCIPRSRSRIFRNRIQRDTLALKVHAYDLRLNRRT